MSPPRAGHGRPGHAAAHAAHRAGVHGPEARPRHQAVPPDRARQGGLLQAVRQLSPSPGEGGVSGMFREFSRAR